MRRFLISLIIAALFIGQGFSVAAAMCHHGSAREHAAARESGDRAVAASARSEETAASVAEKKAALAGAGSLYTAVADLPAAPALAVPFTDARRVPWHISEPLVPEGRATSPPLRPPLS